MAFTLLTRDAFLSHLATATNTSFLQSVEMANLLERRGFTVQYVGYQAVDITISALLVSKPMTGGRYMAINGGPIVTNPDHLTAFYQGLMAYAKSQKALELVVKPYQTYQTFNSQGQALDEERPELIEELTALGFTHQGLTTGYPNGEPTWYYLTDLTGLNLDNLSQAFSKKGQVLLNKMHSFGITLRKLTKDELPLFKAITASTSERRQYTDKSLDYYHDFYQAFDTAAEFMVAEIRFETYRNNLLTSQAQLATRIVSLKADLETFPKSHKKQNQLREYQSQYDTFTQRLEEAEQWLTTYGTEPLILAASLFIYTPQEAVYLFSGSKTEFNKFYAPIALQEHALREAIKRQIPTYNLLGIQGVFDQTDGVLRFKQNLNGHIVRKMGTFHYFPFPLKHRLMQCLKKCLRR